MQLSPQLETLSVCGYLWLGWLAYWVISSRFVQKNLERESYLMRAQHIVPLVISFSLVFHSDPYPISVGKIAEPDWLRWVGTALTAAGLGFAIWARLHLGRYWSGIITLKEGHKLIRSGPYGMVRHPIYTGFLIGITGAAIASGRGEGFVGVLLVLISFLFKLRREEKLMTRAFGGEYLVFQNEVPALFPGIY